MESELESCNSDASTETYVMSPPPTIDSTGSAGSRSPSPGLVPGVLMEQSTIYRTPGGITVLTVNNPEELNIDLFIEAMVTLPPVSIRSTASPPLCLLRSRVEQLLDQAGGQSNLNKLKFVTMCANEIMGVFESDFISKVDGTKPKFNFSSCIHFKRFGKTRRTKEEDKLGYGFYQLRPNIVSLGMEDQLIEHIGLAFNSNQEAKRRPPKERLTEEVLDMAKVVQCPTVFKIKSFLMVEETGVGDEIQILTKVGFGDWKVPTTHTLTFMYRPGEIFVYTTGNAFVVIEPFIDHRFPILVSMALSGLKPTILYKSVFCDHRRRFSDNLRVVDVLSRLVVGESSDLSSLLSLQKEAYILRYAGYE